MPDPALICQVTTEGGTFRDWLSVVVTHNIAQSWMRDFRLVTAEVNDKTQRRLVPGDRVSIALAGEPVITDGVIKTRQALIDANRHAIQVDGFGAAGVTTQVSAQSGKGQFRGYTLSAIANAVLKPLGLKFRVEGKPEGADMPFPNFRIRHGESPFDIISRLATQRGLWLHADVDGTIVGGTSNAGGGATYAEGVNILSATCLIDYLPASGLVFRSQTQGSDAQFGKTATEISAKAPIMGASFGLPLIGLAEMPLQQKELQLRTNMEAMRLNASAVQVALTYQGWLSPTGGLWNLSDSVSVKAPSIIPTETGQMDLKVWGVTYTQSEGGTTTTLDLRNPTAFGLGTGDGTATDNFYQVPGEAQPEAAT